MNPVNCSIKGFLETSFVDWPGKMAAVLFLGRCNYRCPYCHNHRLVTEPGGLPDWPLPLVLEKLEPLRGWLDGVCVTGGEPTVSPGGLDLLRLLKREGWAIKLDTNGSRPDVIGTILAEGLAAAFSVDVKAPLEPIPYRRNGGQGADPEKVRESLALLAASGLPVYLRTTVHPSLLTLAEVTRMAGQVTEIFGRPVEIKLQRARVEDALDPSLADSQPIDADTLAAWQRALSAPPTAL